MVILLGLGKLLKNRIKVEFGLLNFRAKTRKPAKPGIFPGVFAFLNHRPAIKKALCKKG